MTTSHLTSSTTAVTHVVRVRHALTGGAVPSLRATLVPPTPWWYAAKLTPRGDVAVFAADRYPNDGPDPVIRLSVTDPQVAAALLQPLVELTLTQAEQDHAFASAPQTVSAVLTTATGAAHTGSTVTAVPAAQSAIALSEVAGVPGTYRCEPRTWTNSQLTFEIRADDQVVGHYRLDPFALGTRLHGVVA